MSLDRLDATQVGATTHGCSPGTTIQHVSTGPDRVHTLTEAIPLNQCPAKYTGCIGQYQDRGTEVLSFAMQHAAL
eukprot:3869125-Rhodomonas_salina.5